MKTKLFSYALLLLAVISLGSCDDDDDETITGNTVTFTATINAASEVPTNASTATGMGNFMYDKTTKMLSGTVTFTGLTPTGAHIHKGAVGVSGDVVIPLATTPPITSPITLAPIVLNASQETDLMANLHYVNIHSVAYPGGEIRGQLMMKASSTSMTGTGGY